MTVRLATVIRVTNISNDFSLAGAKRRHMVLLEQDGFADEFRGPI